MLRRVCEVLMDVYGYDIVQSVTTPLLDKYNVMLASGPVTILLLDDADAEIVTMTVIENALEYKTAIHYKREDYADMVLNCLLTFATARSLPQLLGKP